jgi:penicillin-binding protein 2
VEKNKTSQDSIKILNRRSFIIIILGIFFSFVVAVRLFSLQILNFGFYKKKSVENKVSVKATPPLRGDIYDSNKNLLAGNTSFYEFVIYKNLNKNYLKEIKKINSLIGLNLNIDEIYKKLEKFNPYSAYTISKASWDQIVEFEKNKFLFTSIKIIESKKRFYPYKNLSQIIGYVGNSSDSSHLYPKGIFHIEKGYENHLKGSPGKIFNEVNSKGKIVRDYKIIINLYCLYLIKVQLLLSIDLMALFFQ